MSILHEFLILLENEGSVPIYRFNRWGKTKAKGALGKLLALKYIKKVEDKSFETTGKGLDFVDKILASIRQERIDWLKDDVNFLSIKFPETERGKRDKLRSFLKMSSFLKVGGVWVVPERDKDELVKMLENDKVLGEVLLIKGKLINSQILSQLDEKREELEKKYSSWMLEVENKLKSLSGRADRDYVTKKLIFEYALIKKEDLLPSNVIPNSWVDKKAHQHYLRIKKHLS